MKLITGDTVLSLAAFIDGIDNPSFNSFPGSRNVILTIVKFAPLKGD